MTHPHLSKRTFNFIQNTTKTKIIFTFNFTGPGGGGWRFAKSSEEVEAEKSILQTSSSQLFYTRFVKMDHLILMMSPLCVSFLK